MRRGIRRPRSEMHHFAVVTVDNSTLHPLPSTPMSKRAQSVPTRRRRPIALRPKPKSKSKSKSKSGKSGRSARHMTPRQSAVYELYRRLGVKSEVARALGITPQAVGMMVSRAMSHLPLVCPGCHQAAVIDRSARAGDVCAGCMLDVANPEIDPK